MAKYHLDRLRKKYGWTGGEYQDLLVEIMSENTQTIKNKVQRITNTEWGKALKKISTKEKQFIIPTTEATAPKQSVSARKAAESGRLISDTLRDKITSDLRSTLNQFTPKTGEATFIRRRGAAAGKINTKLIDQFEEKLRGTFQQYTKKDPRVGMPSNIHTIAVTEFRSSVNEYKDEYMRELMRKNEDLEITKIWVHNKSLSKEPRPGHIQMNNKKAPEGAKFMVPLYRSVGGKMVRVGMTAMKHPHDPTAPPEQVISCNCELRYEVKRGA